MDISWTESVQNEEVLHSVKKDRNGNNKKKEGEIDGHISRINCLLRQVTGRQIEGKRSGRRGRRRQHPWMILGSERMLEIER